MRWLGPFSRGHRRALTQLRAAFSSISSLEARIVLRGMWDNLGRTFGEYAHIRELMASSVDTPAAGQVVMDNHTAELLRGVDPDRRGALMFSAHLGNWEIPAMMARVGGREIALVYRAQPSKIVTAQLVHARALFAGRLIEAGPSAPRQMLKALRDGCLVGMLVDQHYAGGVEVSFFGHVCRVNPILARLARLRDCPVYGARTVRLRDQRHRFELIGPLEFPRDEAGKVDVPGAMQMILSIIESWIREHPEQWIWWYRFIR
jgi:KDO2-lipid IV(A) lauroyltransferase